MSSTTVAEFANELKKSTDTLLEQLKSAGVAKSAATDVLTDADKHSLLNFLQSSHGTANADRKKITLVKKQTTEIKQADATGKARTIQVEVRKKRTFVRREDGSDQPQETVEAEAATASASVIDEAELARREEEARRQAEFIRRQEEELAQRRREREEQEARAHAAAEKAAEQTLQEPQALDSTPVQETSGSAPLKSVPAQPDPVEVARVATAVREKAAAASKVIADEEVARAADLGNRRRKAEAEAAAIRSMMYLPCRFFRSCLDEGSLLSRSAPAISLTYLLVRAPGAGSKRLRAIS